jgi:hypothetical protein
MRQLQCTNENPVRDGIFVEKKDNQWVEPCKGGTLFMTANTLFKKKFRTYGAYFIQCLFFYKVSAPTALRCSIATLW